MAKVLSMTIGIPGVELWINYNAANLRITTVQWTIPASGVLARAQIWNSGNLVYDRTINGPASGTENVPGNHTLVLKTTPDGLQYYWLPAYLTYRINVETIG